MLKEKMSGNFPMLCQGFRLLVSFPANVAFESILFCVRSQMRVKVNSVVELFVAFIALECSISVDVVHVHSEVILRFVPEENEEEG